VSPGRPGSIVALALYNSDGESDNVDCGAGTADDAEVDALDTLTGCEI